MLMLDCPIRSNETHVPWIMSFTSSEPLACSKCDVSITEPSASTPRKSTKTNNDHLPSLIENMTPIQPVYHSALETNIFPNICAIFNQYSNSGLESSMHTNESHIHGPHNEAMNITEENSLTNVAKPSTVSKKQRYLSYCSSFVCPEEVTTVVKPISNAVYNAKVSTTQTHTLKCPTCDYFFYRKVYATKFARKHTIEKPLACPSCDSKSVREEHIRSHTANHTDGDALS